MFSEKVSYCTRCGRESEDIAHRLCKSCREEAHTGITKVRSVGQTPKDQGQQKGVGLFQSSQGSSAPQTIVRRHRVEIVDGVSVPVIVREQEVSRTPIHPVYDESPVQPSLQTSVQSSIHISVQTSAQSPIHIPAQSSTQITVETQADFSPEEKARREFLSERLKMFKAVYQDYIKTKRNLDTPPQLDELNEV